MKIVFFLLFLSAFKADPESESVVPLYAFTLKQPYIEENLNNRFWNFGGDTIVEVNQQARLTTEAPSKSGWLWSKLPLTSASWVIEFEFKVHSTNHNGLFGDGFAFWFTKDKEQEGKVFGSKDKFEGLGVFFDTYSNGRHRHTFPYVSAMLGDGKMSYDHDNDGKNGEIGGCPSDFRGWEHPTKAKIKYVKDQFLQIQLNVFEDGLWRDCFLSKNTTLPAVGYVGFSAHTGEVYDIHDIVSVTTHAIINPHQYKNTEFNGANSGGGGGSSSFFSGIGGGVGTFVSWIGWIILALVFILGGAYAYVKYSENKRARSYKRF